MRTQRPDIGAHRSCSIHSHNFARNLPDWKICGCIAHAGKPAVTKVLDEESNLVGAFEIVLTVWAGHFVKNLQMFSYVLGKNLIGRRHHLVLYGHEHMR